jgi:mRNA deadenylase 3'-5' endonuclease subunit Ccr4
MTYNMLADSLCDINDPDFVDIPIDVLRWTNRCGRLQKQLIVQNADLACLQELDAAHVGQFMSAFDASAWRYLYKQRTGANRDGCALLWKTSVFELVAERSLEFKNMPGADGVTPLSFMDRDNVAQVVVLRHRASGRLLIVGNCHLLFKQNRGEIKLAQLMGIFRAIAEFKALYQSDAAEPPAVLVGGDFNSTPISGIYSLVTTGVLDLRVVDTRLLSGQQRFVKRFQSPSAGVLHKPVEVRQIMSIAAKHFGPAPDVAQTEPAAIVDQQQEEAVDEEDAGDDAGGDDDDDREERRTRPRVGDDDDGGDGATIATSASASTTAAASTSATSESPTILHHTLDLQSVYPRSSEIARNAATMMRKRRTDQKWVDHIFTSQQLRVVSVLAVPHNPREKISPFGLPTRNHPSDHLPLCAVVEFK